MPFHKDPWGYSLGKGVRPLSVIEPLDVIKDICPGVGASLIPPPMHPFPFEYGKNALRHGMVITVPHATHAADNPMRVEKRLTLLRRVLGAPVGMEDDRLRTPLLPHGHQYGLEDQVARQLRLHRPPNHLARKQIEDHG